jgi:hypothetical protein
MTRFDPEGGHGAGIKKGRQDGRGQNEQFTLSERPQI